MTNPGNLVPGYSFFKLYFNNYLFYVYGFLPAYMYASHVCLVPSKVRRGCQILWN